MMRLFIPAAAAAFLVAPMAGDAEAQVLKRGVQGGVAGAIIGGIVGGGDGIGKGAAIGAGVGVVAGAIEADQRRGRSYAAYPPPPPAYDPYFIRDIQGSLYNLGYNPGPVDGQYGRGTADAIAAYQADYGLPVDGRPSERLLDDMRRHGG